MVDLIEEFLKVDIYGIAVTLGNVFLALTQCLMGVAFWSEPITVVRKLWLGDGSKNLANGLLDNPVNYRVGIPNWRLLPFSLGISTLRTGLGRYLPLCMDDTSSSLCLIR